MNSKMSRKVKKIMVLVNGFMVIKEVWNFSTDHSKTTIKQRTFDKIECINVLF